MGNLLTGKAIHDRKLTFTAKVGKVVSYYVFGVASKEIEIQAKVERPTIIIAESVKQTPFIIPLTIGLFVLIVLGLVLKMIAGRRKVSVEEKIQPVKAPEKKEELKQEKIVEPIEKKGFFFKKEQPKITKVDSQNVQDRLKALQDRINKYK